MIGAALVILAAVGSSFAFLLTGSTVLGAGNTAVFLTRYAAVEVGDDAMRGRAIGTVLFAAVLGAVASPNLLGLPPLTGLYVVAILCFSVAALLLAAMSNPGGPYFGSGAALLGVVKRSRVSRRDIVSRLSTSSTRTALGVLTAVSLPAWIERLSGFSDNEIRAAAASCTSMARTY